MKSFYEWAVEKYLGKDTPRGDFAGDASTDVSFPKTGDRDAVLSYLVARHACSECLSVVKRMWKDYEKWTTQNA